MKFKIMSILLMSLMALSAFAKGDEPVLKEIYSYSSMQTEDKNHKISDPYAAKGTIQMMEWNDTEYLAFTHKKEKEDFDIRIIDSDLIGDMDGEWYIEYLGWMSKGKKRVPAKVLRNYDHAVDAVDPINYIVMELDPDSYDVVNVRVYLDLEYLGK